MKRGLKNYARQDSNLQPSVPKTDALSSCATGANRFFKIRFQSRGFKRRGAANIPGSAAGRAADRLQ
jgi:hypothetical protein